MFDWVRLEKGMYMLHVRNKLIHKQPQNKQAFRTGGRVLHQQNGLQASKPVACTLTINNALPTACLADQGYAGMLSQHLPNQQLTLAGLAELADLGVLGLSFLVGLLDSL